MAIDFKPKSKIDFSPKVGNIPTNTDIEQSSLLGSLLKNPFVGFGKDILTSLGSTAARLTISAPPFLPFKPLIPEKIPTLVGEISFKYSEKPFERLKQYGEDILNVLPGGMGAKLTAEQLAQKGAKGFSGRLVQSAFKISETDLRRSPNLIYDFLKERISGFSKRRIANMADAVVNASEQTLDNVIDASTKAGTKILTKDVVKAVEPLREMVSNSAFADDVLPIIDSKVESFLKKGAEITLKEAQEFKKNTYRLIKDSGYGQLVSGAKESAKQLARGVKEAIEVAIPEVKIADLNKKMAIYGKARDLMERQINKLGKNELIGLYDTILAGGGVVAKAPLMGLSAAIVTRIARSTPFKTYAARVLTSTSLEAIKRASILSIPLIRSVSSSLLQNEQENE